MSARFCSNPECGHAQALHHHPSVAPGSPCVLKGCPCNEFLYPVAINNPLRAEARRMAQQILEEARHEVAN